ANQVATGLALTLFGLGLSGLVGVAFVGQPGLRLASFVPAALIDLPVVGRLVFGHDPLVYLSLVLVAAVAWWLARTRSGLV
ncbi:ABC transporter permease, partial [Mycobacterium tuberculosis]|nr:ABC transporter permease [Mycobacterium tuberculosis]